MMISPRVLFYCQHLLGIGHLTRSLAIAQAFCDQGADVSFVQGGPEVGKGLIHPRFHKIQLSPLLMHEDTNELYDPSGKLTPEELLQKRNEELLHLAALNPFDIVVTELFPFGRNKLKPEILLLLERVRKKNSLAIVACSVRDILVEKSDALKRAEKTNALISNHYNWVLVHSDPQFIRLEETYPLIAPIQDRIFYSGFVSETNPSSQEPRERKKRILVSQGGGAVGIELLLAVAEVTENFPEYKFEFILGPNAPDASIQKLNVHLRNKKNVEVLRFRENFEEALSECQLSISLAGYNTVMNLLRTKTPALVYPYDANHEQRLRSERLAEREVLKVLEVADLDPHRLRKLIEKSLSLAYPHFDLDLEGAKNSARFLIDSFQMQSIAKL